MIHIIRKKWLAGLLAAGMICGGLTACANEQKSGTTHPEDADKIANTPSFRESSFDEKLVTYFDTYMDGNYMVSPLSFRYATGLLLGGAAGETLNELQNALGAESAQAWAQECLEYQSFVDSFNENAGNRLQRFNDLREKGYYDAAHPLPSGSFAIANSVWSNETNNIRLTDTYATYIGRYFAAESKTFTPKNAVDAINAWVNEKTEGMIPALLDKSADFSDTALALVNTLYFKDDWEIKFDPERTKEGDFHTQSGETVKKEFMRHSGEKFPYYKDDNTEMVVLPLCDGVNMAFVMGDNADFFGAVSKVQSTEAQVSIPKFALETSFDNGELAEYLKALGVNLAFDKEKADFSAMCAEEHVYIDDIIQKTKIEINETGVAASAATAYELYAGGMPDDEYVVFTADHPFSFYIYTQAEDGTVTLLFAGRIVE